MRRILLLTAIAMPLPANAHVGHLGELAGHSHWIALGAFGIATVIGALASAKGKKSSAEAGEDSPAEDDADTQEAAA